MKPMRKDDKNFVRKGLAREAVALIFKGIVRRGQEINQSGLFLTVLAGGQAMKQIISLKNLKTIRI